MIVLLSFVWGVAFIVAVVALLVALAAFEDAKAAKRIAMQAQAFMRQKPTPFVQETRAVPVGGMEPLSDA